MPKIVSTGNVISSGVMSVSMDGFAINSDIDCELLSVGDLKYSFDNVGGEKDSNSLFVRAGECSISILDKLGDGSSFFDKVFDLGYETQIKTSFTLAHNSSETYSFVFYFRRENVEVDEVKGECKIKLLPIFNAGEQNNLQQFGINSYFNGTLSVDPSSYTVDAVDASEDTKITQVVSSGRFIKDTLKVYSGFDDFILDSDVHEDITSFTNLEGYNLVGDPDPPSGDTDVVFSTTSILEQVKDFAAREGAIFGHSFGKNFYVQRLKTNNNVSIEVSHVETLGSKITDRLFRSIDVLSIAGQSYDGSPLEQTTSKNYVLGGYKTFRYRSYQYAELTGQYRDSIDLPTVPPAQGPEEQTTFNNVFFLGGSGQGISVDTDASVDAYAAALSATSPRVVRAKIFGIDRLFPWNTFNITNNSSSILRDNFAARYTGIVFRPSILSYSFIDDTIDVTAYEIGNVQSVQSSTTTPAAAIASALDAVVEEGTTSGGDGGGDDDPGVNGDGGNEEGGGGGGGGAPGS